MTSHTRRHRRVIAKALDTPSIPIRSASRREANPYPPCDAAPEGVRV